jgi:hypothetical protein
MIETEELKKTILPVLAGIRPRSGSGARAQAKMAGAGLCLLLLAAQLVAFASSQYVGGGKVHAGP